ncbi:Guanylate kinase [Ferrithrix thermotolerans DSM 19514]|uniref:Guanylate kinase n=1 Tax=Ferrithrix thermotolerans DSM 19514 TaxID=1121881 RepID=A0A1M4T703_9ACTN|nr:Guanylate kinase [Ferrithrix thermotolerans DSM 19514]
MEWAEFNGNLYGTPLPDHQGSTDLLLEIDSQGAHSIKKLFPDSLVVLLLSPSEDSLRERMRQRGDDEAHIDARVRLAKKEIASAREVADYEVINLDLDRAVAEIASMIYKARESKSRGGDIGRG